MRARPLFQQDDYIFGALNAGASAFLLKRTKPEELLAAVQTLAAGLAPLTVGQPKSHRADD